MRLRRVPLLVAALGLGYACSFPEVSFGPADATSTGAGGSGGATPECRNAADCAIPAESCRVATCDGGVCGVAEQTSGACGEGLVCNDDAECIQCASTMDCDEGECIDSMCVPSSCTDQGRLIECGGDCPPCDDGAMCDVPTDCASGFCNAGTCAPCMNDSQCSMLDGTFCDDGTCAPELGLGVACTADNECQSGHCPDNDFLCCEVACDGRCEACRKVHTGVDNGTCAPIQNGDPDNECDLFTTCPDNCIPLF